jgi:hypothetical protein
VLQDSCTEDNGRMLKDNSACLPMMGITMKCEKGKKEKNGSFKNLMRKY